MDTDENTGGNKTETKEIKPETTGNETKMKEGETKEVNVKKEADECNGEANENNKTSTQPSNTLHGFFGMKIVRFISKILCGIQTEFHL